MPDNQDKKPQTETDARDKASKDKLSSANATVEAATIAGGEQRSPQQAQAGSQPEDRATQASQAAQNRRRDENGRFATDDDGREPSRASRSRQDNDYRDRYGYADEPRRREYDYEARDRSQRNLFEDPEGYRSRERERFRDEDPRSRWASQSRGDYERYSRDRDDDYRRYGNQDRPPERYDERRAWSQTGERGYDNYREPPRSGWASQGDQQRHRDWDRDDRDRYNARRDYDDDYTRLQRGYRDGDDYDRRSPQDSYRDERPHEYARSDDRTRYQYNDYHPVDRERSWPEARHDAGYIPRRGPGRRDER